MKTVVVHVDRLVLKGIPTEHRDAFAEILREELRERLADPERVRRLSEPGHGPRPDARRVQVPSGGVASETARRAARAIAWELTP